jgi:hypothetical protein
MKDFNLLDMLKDFKGNEFLREFYYFMSGFLMILILNLLLKPRLELYPNFKYLGDIGKIVSIIIISYFFSRLCCEIGNILVNTFIFLFVKNKKSVIKEYFDKVKKYINQEPTILAKTSDINHMELHNFIYNNKGICSLYERNIQFLIFEKTFLGFLFLLIIFYFYTLIPFFLLLIKIIIDEVEINELKVENARLLIKNNEHKN